MFSELISNDDPKALEKLREKLELIENQREAIREYNKVAKKTKGTLIPTNKGDNLRNRASQIRKRIEMLETRENLENKEFEVNKVKVIENYKINRLQFYFKEPPTYKTIKALTRFDFEWNKFSKCWQKELSNDDSKYLKILDK